MRITGRFIAALTLLALTTACSGDSVTETSGDTLSEQEVQEIFAAMSAVGGAVMPLGPVAAPANGPQLADIPIDESLNDTADCPNAEPALLDRERLVTVEWDLAGEQSYPVRIRVESRDKPGLLAAITGVIAEAGVNIAGGKVSTEAGRGVHEFELEIRNLEQLRKLLEQVRRVKGVTRVDRLRAGTGAGVLL